MSKIVLIVSLIVAAALAGCAGGGNKIEAIYELTALDTPPVSSGTSAQILVPEPRALQSLASSKIAVKPTAMTVSYYPNVALQDDAPKVFQRMLLDTFENTGRVHAVGLPGQSLLINYQVVSEIRAFQVETFAGNRARVVVAVKLLNDSNGRVLRTEVFETVVPIGSDAVETAAEGMNAAAQQAALDIVTWTLAAI
ncbi:ABC-type transport auxiliary lipoprotein family protein [Acuticoccus yangtzensis]|uniref:ABC-type transport auxiliary lipoprotein family protein n=1 Tax=Acuticoccus yangtzensis TaxID=1443441 RepID=UPI0009FB16C5|nr:ABC-type transport auxiliary lipoprotein family protein [Acuticoccus yangtzensis]